MTRLKLLHLYNRLVRRGAADALVCVRCGLAVAVRTADPDTPWLQCFGCDTMDQLGIKDLNKIQAVVTEFYPHLSLN